MYIQNHAYAITKTYNKVIFYRFLEQLDLLLLNNGIKRKFKHFLRLTISDILKGGCLSNVAIMSGDLWV